ncbi:alpha-amylase family glycosyl hydrolase [Arenimonas sp. MALMAid1274]|uniref:alpha-amylase family glycosyl hydrolase n=1 Tax=Arenimonas sp. MALMAid1274 TaxID=3411630 RepID=UPI003BA0FC29
MSLTRPSLLALATCLALATGCGAPPATPAAPDAAATVDPAAPASLSPREVAPSYYGTLEPMAEHAVYFVVTDRFVNGDPGNDHRDQGGEHPSFDIPLPCGGEEGDNIGYLGGDFRGLLDNAGYLRELGFGAVWITPIVDNPDQAFTGGDAISCTSFLTDRGKSGYHGYWATNFHVVDEHLESPGLAFADLTRGLRAQGLKTVLDIVGNHGSPGWTMPVAQPGFGQVFDKDGTLVADHGNLPPGQLDPAHNPLHAFYNTKPDLAQLSDFDAGNPAVMDHLVSAYLQWAAQGVDAFRIDTIRHQPLSFWKEFADRIRAKHPGFFMFGEAFDYDAATIAPFTWPENGGISVLDFPVKKALSEAVDRDGGDYATLAAPLALENGPYQNPYELMTFYDNHDMARLDASDEGFIDAHHWLFTARGTPVIYYGSETGFMRGRVEHSGNRNYFGQQRVDQARSHPIYLALKRIAAVRAASPALQRGLQLNLELQGDRAAFYRVYQHGGKAQIALVLLNKGDAPTRFAVSDYLQAGTWRAALAGGDITVAAGGTLEAEVPAHGAEVFLLDAEVAEPRLAARLAELMASARRRTSDG